MNAKIKDLKKGWVNNMKNSVEEIKKFIEKSIPGIEYVDEYNDDYGTYTIVYRDDDNEMYLEYIAEAVDEVLENYNKHYFEGDCEGHNYHLGWYGTPLPQETSVGTTLYRIYFEDLDEEIA